jgi:hypothetical protein
MTDRDPRVRAALRMFGDSPRTRRAIEMTLREMAGKKGKRK